MTLQVFQILNNDWYAGDCTPEEILAFYMQDTGLTKDEATDGEDYLPRALSDEEMDSLIIHVTGSGEPRPMTFREYLTWMVDQGTQFPSRFATTEW